MTILAYGRHTEASIRARQNEQARRTTERKAREARAAAMRANEAALRRMEREAKDAIWRRELARLFDAASNRVERSRGGVVGFKTIERRICRVFKITPAQMVSRERGNEVRVLALQAVMYWSRRLTTASSCDLARRLDRDHSTLIHGCESYVAKRAKQNRTLRPIGKGKFGKDWKR